jgi:hypothetical protein
LVTRLTAIIFSLSPSSLASACARGVNFAILMFLRCGAA